MRISSEHEQKRLYLVWALLLFLFSFYTLRNKRSSKFFPNFPSLDPYFSGLMPSPYTIVLKYQVTILRQSSWYPRSMKMKSFTNGNVTWIVGEEELPYVGWIPAQSPPSIVNWKMKYFQWLLYPKVFSPCTTCTCTLSISASRLHLGIRSQAKRCPNKELSCLCSVFLPLKTLTL